MSRVSVWGVGFISSTFVGTGSFPNGWSLILMRFGRTAEITNHQSLITMIRCPILSVPHVNGFHSYYYCYRKYEISLGDSPVKNVKGP